MPLSTLLADAVLERLARAEQGVYTDPETHAAAPVLETQRDMSLLPVPGRLLIEFLRDREGHHVFVHSFARRLANEGLSTLTAFRIARESPRSITTMCSDYGFELLCRKKFSTDVADWKRWLGQGGLAEDLLQCLNATELARRRFRDIARVAGLVFEGLPGRMKSLRQIQSSSGLLYDVFTRFDPENLLLTQARREVLESQLDLQRLQQWTARTADLDFRLVTLERLTPLSFPLWAERIREFVSTEEWHERIRAAINSMEETPAP